MYVIDCVIGLFGDDEWAVVGRCGMWKSVVYYVWADLVDGRIGEVIVDVVENRSCIDVFV